jgi:hypothetical protein
MQVSHVKRNLKKNEIKEWIIKGLKISCKHKKELYPTNQNINKGAKEKNIGDITKS